jgi:alpha-L-arabinofuranosidase
VSLDILVVGQPGARVRTATLLSDPDIHATNTQGRPGRIGPRSLAGAAIDGRQLRVALPPVAWAHVRLARPPG